MSVSSPGFQADLHPSPKPVIVMLLGFGVTLVLLNHIVFDPSKSFLGAVFGSLFYILSGLGWFAYSWKAWLGQWILILGLIAIIALAYVWFSVPGILTLLIIPIGFAVAWSDFVTATIAAWVETFLLIALGLYVTPAADWSLIAVALAAIWIMLGTIYAACVPAYHLAEWSWTYYRQAQLLLDEARDRKAELTQAMNDLTHTNRQLALATERIATLRMIAETAFQSKAAFVAKVSHEFRTPLNIIIGMVNLMVESPEVYKSEFPPKALEHLQTVYRTSQHLASMIDDVLDLSQADTGHVTIHREQVDLGEIVRSSVTVVQSLLEEKRLALDIHIPADLPSVYCDRLRIRQVLLNLISNAARFTEKGGITIKLIQQAQNILVSVADTGPGISPKDVERIFQPFYQTRDEPWHDGKGSGLGLSISKQFVELHGGRMWLESQVDVGTVFHIELPLAPPAPLVVHAESLMREGWEWLEHNPRTNLPPSHYRPRIIVCDETGELSGTLTHLTEEVEFVDSADLNGAIEEAQQASAQAILINTRSPSTLWSQIAQVKRQVAQLPIIGSCYPSKKEHVLQTGIADYLIKPVTRADLSRAIAAIGKPIQRILVVEDDADTREFITLLLRAINASAQIVTAENGKQALEEMRACQPELLILDIMMPDMDGWQVLAVKDKDEAIRNIPVIIVSAQDIGEGPRMSEVIVATIGEGLSVTKFLDCSRDLWTRLLQAS